MRSPKGGRPLRKAARMSTYYTKEDKTPKVFHVWTNCPEGEQILEKNKVSVLADRRLCESCASMDYKKKS